MKTKIANSLVDVKTLWYYDFPFVEHVRDPETGQDWILAWYDEEPEMVQWHAFSVTPENLALYLSKDPQVAISFKELILRTLALYRCASNTYHYSTILEGERIEPKDIPDEIMPTDDSYHHLEVSLWHENNRTATQTVADAHTQSDASSSATN